MSLTFRKKLNEIVESDHFGVIQIKTSPVIFHKRFFGVSIQVKTRIVKLLGLGTEVNLGLISDFKIQIDRILQVKTENRVFGEYYSNSTLGV